MISKLIKTKNGRILISIILGLGLSSIFRKVCKDRNCIVYKAPNPKTIVNNVYKHNNKCYKYDIETTKCTKDVIKH